MQASWRVVTLDARQGAQIDQDVDQDVEVKVNLRGMGEAGGTVAGGTEPILFSAFLASDPGILIWLALALARILLQVFINGQYGFHQDELVTLDAAAHHLSWGYVAWPPVTPCLARLSLMLYGPSLIGLRSFAVVAEGIVMLLSGLMIRDLGGSRWAQILGAVAVATTPNSIVQGGLFQYETLSPFRLQGLSWGPWRPATAAT